MPKFGRELFFMEDQPKKKKPYSKPEIFFESFTISTHIAADCEVRANFGENQCGAYLDYTRCNVFNSGISDCAIKVPVAQGYYRLPDWTIVCYSNMGDSCNVFNS